MSKNKILKLSGNEYYEVVPNDKGNCNNCSFSGNCGNCWLACNGYHCEIDNKKFIYRRLPDLFSAYQNDDNYKQILDIVENTKVNDFLSEQEQDMIKLVINTYLKHDDHYLLKDSRILCNKTFALRLYNFLSDIKSDDTEEINKLNESVSFAKELLNYQLKTCTDEKEFEYFRNVGLCDENNNVKLV